MNELTVALNLWCTARNRDVLRLFLPFEASFSSLDLATFPLIDPSLDV